MSDLETVEFWNENPFDFSTLHNEGSVAFFVRVKSSQQILGVFFAQDELDLFQSIDEVASPYDCEYSVMSPGDGFFLDSSNEPTLTELAGGRLRSKRAWHPVDTECWRKYWADKIEQRRLKELASFEEEVAKLGDVFKGLKRTAHDRFNRHGRRSRKDAGALAQD